MSASGIESFNGERLKRALDARRWSVSDLSEYTDISTSMIYQLIKNERKPSYETLKKIASQTNLPESYYSKDFKHEKAHPFFRKFTRSAKKRRRSTEMQIDWLIELKNFLDKYIEFPTFDVPKIEELKGKSPLRLENPDIELIAARVREYWGLGDNLLPSITNIIENRGILVSKFTFETQDIDALSKYEVKRKNAFIILSRDKGQASRNRFDLAHELGHCILHRKLNPEEKNLAEKENHKVLENQANRFAGAFLLPQNSFANDFEYATLEAFKALKVKYGVSIASLVYRAKQLGLINNRTYKNLQINISRKKWRSKEPLESEIPNEEPSLIRKALDLVLEEDVLTLQSLINKVGLNQGDIERISGLELGYLDKYKGGNKGTPNLRLVK